MIHLKNAISLVDVEQRTVESLRSYLARFNTTTTNVRRLYENLVLMAIIVGVNKRMRFSHDLTKEKHRKLKEFYYKANKYLRLEEVDAKLGRMVQPVTR